MPVFYRLATREIGQVGSDGSANITYERLIARRTPNTGSAYGAFTKGAASSIGCADFNRDYEPVNLVEQQEMNGNSLGGVREHLRNIGTKPAGEI